MYNSSYDKKVLLKSLMLLGLSLVAMKLVSSIGFVLVIAYGFMAMMRGRDEELFFTLLWMLSLMMSNSFFVPKDVVFYTGQRGFLLIVALVTATRMFGQQCSRLIAPLWGIVFYLLYMLIPSLCGWMPMISFLKIFLFLMIFIAFMGIVNKVSMRASVRPQVIRSMFLAMAIYFIFGSVAVIPFPAIGQMKFDEIERGRVMVSLFKGMSVHSQSLGPLVSGLMVLVLGDMVFGLRKMDRLYLALLACCPILIYKTSSRTALGTAVGGVAVLMFLLMQARGLGSRWKSRVLSSLTMIGVAVGLVLVVLPSSRAGLARYLTKSTESGAKEVNFENISSSRMGLVLNQLANFRKSPMIGNGFQVSEMMQKQKVRDWRQLLSAPVEKGVWVTAVLEEGGVAGAVVLGIALLSIFMALSKIRAYIGMSTLFTLLLSNMGEFSMFSMSAIGGFMWGLVFVGLALDSQRIKQDVLMSQPMMPPAGMDGFPSFGPRV